MKPIAILEHDMRLAHDILDESRKISGMNVGLHKRYLLRTKLRKRFARERKASSKEYSSLLKEASSELRSVKGPSKERLKKRIDKVRKFYAAK